MTELSTTTNGKKKGARKTRVPANESKDEAFVRLTVHRMNGVMGKIRQLKNLARYPHTEEQAKRIISELKALVTDVEAAFAPREKNEQFKF